MDKLVKAMAHDGRIRLYVAVTTDLVQFAQSRHQMYPTSAAALGRLLSAGVLMGSMLKSDKEKISLMVRGSNEIKAIVVDAQHDGTVRGFISNPHVMLLNSETGKLDVGAAIGSGTLQVLKDMNMKSDFVSTIDLQSGEIGDDLAYYFTVSEQTPSAVSVGVLVNPDNTIASAGAMIIQLMPDSNETDVEMAEYVVSHLKPISQMISEGMEAHEIASLLFEDVQILEQRDVSFTCDCSKDKFARGLLTIEVRDLKDMINEDHGAHLVCHYCNEDYEFSEEELKEILLKKVNHVAHS